MQNAAASGLARFRPEPSSGGSRILPLLSDGGNIRGSCPRPVRGGVTHPGTMERLMDDAELGVPELGSEWMGVEVYSRSAKGPGPEESEDAVHPAGTRPGGKEILPVSQGGDSTAGLGRRPGQTAGPRARRRGGPR